MAEIRTDFTRDEQIQIWENAQQMAAASGKTPQSELYDYAMSQGYSHDDLDKAMDEFFVPGQTQQYIDIIQSQTNAAFGAGPTTPTTTKTNVTNDASTTTDKTATTGVTGLANVMAELPNAKNQTTMFAQGTQFSPELLGGAKQYFEDMNRRIAAGEDVSGLIDARRQELGLTYNQLASLYSQSMGTDPSVMQNAINVYLGAQDKAPVSYYDQQPLTQANPGQAQVLRPQPTQGTDAAGMMSTGYQSPVPSSIADLFNSVQGVRDVNQGYLSAPRSDLSQVRSSMEAQYAAAAQKAADAKKAADDEIARQAALIAQNNYGGSGGDFGGGGYTDGGNGVGVNGGPVGAGGGNAAAGYSYGGW